MVGSKGEKCVRGAVTAEGRCCMVLRDFIGASNIYPVAMAGNSSSPAGAEIDR